jgi:hypothetical protein
MFDDPEHRMIDEIFGGRRKLAAENLKVRAPEIQVPRLALPILEKRFDRRGFRTSWRR